jgi:hypothetical protein
MSMAGASDIKQNGLESVEASSPFRFQHFMLTWFVLTWLCAL